MSDKIIISELEKLLFPERYPYFETHFSSEMELLKKGNLSDRSYQNLKFKIKTAQHSLSVKDDKLRIVLNYFFEKHIDSYYDWSREYDWHELKSILFYFKVLSQANTKPEIFEKLKSENIQNTFKKYLPHE